VTTGEGVWPQSGPQHNDYSVFSPEAEDHLDALYRYIADASTPDIARGYVDAIVTYCEGLAQFPHRGRAR
jgi:toxin ParE1/3/4